MDSADQLKPKHAGAAFIAARIAEIAESLPELEELTPEAATHIMRLAVVDELKDQVRRRVAAERLDWKAARATFISDKTSQRTRAVYERALGLLEAWMTTHKLTPGELTPREADDFIRELRGRQGRDGKPPDADTVRLMVSVASSFFTFLERRDATIRNPFRGTKIRPRSTWPVANNPNKGGAGNPRRRGPPRARRRAGRGGRDSPARGGPSLPSPFTRKAATGLSPRDIRLWGLTLSPKRQRE